MRCTRYSILTAGALLCAFAAGYAQAGSVSISLDKKASLASDRITLTVIGSYSCSPVEVINPQTDFTSVSIQVRQASGRSITTGGGFLYTTNGDLVCDDTTRTFQSVVSADQQPWHGGQAYAVGTIESQSCPTFFCDHSSARTQSQIQISGGGK